MVGYVQGVIYGPNLYAGECSLAKNPDECMADYEGSNRCHSYSTNGHHAPPGQTRFVNAVLL